MNKKHIAIVIGIAAGYFLAGKLNNTPGFSQAYDFGAKLKNGA